MNRIWSYSIIKSGSMPDRMDWWLRRLLILFENIFSILFYVIFANFKVLGIFLGRVFHVLIVKGDYPIFLEKVFYNLFYFHFHFFLEGKSYVVPLWQGYSTYVQENTICTSWWVLSYCHMLLWISLMKRCISEFISYLFLLFIFIYLYIFF
jgi:hypothetical protein